MGAAAEDVHVHMLDILETAWSLEREGGQRLDTALFFVLWSYLLAFFASLGHALQPTEQLSCFKPKINNQQHKQTFQIQSELLGYLGNLHILPSSFQLVTGAGRHWKSGIRISESQDLSGA